MRPIFMAASFAEQAAAARGTRRSRRHSQKLRGTTGTLQRLRFGGSRPMIGFISPDETYVSVDPAAYIPWIKQVQWDRPSERSAGDRRHPHPA
jgi:hypothetical protein